MRYLPSASLTALAAALCAPAASAQDAAPAPSVQQTSQEGPEPSRSGDDTITDNEIVVIAGSLRGQVDTAQPPIAELNEEDIASYGAGSLAELVAALQNETGSGRGRGSGPPVMLMNGLRVSSFREMRSFPPEAIKKVEILPEEVAQKYGFPPDQRVINFILKDNFASKELELKYGQPYRGGTSSKELEATLLKIGGPSRLNFNLDLKDTSPLLESDRGIIQTIPPGTPAGTELGDFRTLVADTANYTLTGNWTTALGGAGASLSINGTLDRSKSLSLNGLDSVTYLQPLARTTRSDTASFGSTLNVRAGEWQLTGTVDASHSNSDTTIDRISGIGFDTANSKSNSANAKFTAIGHPVELPAGEVSVTLDAGYDWDRITSMDTRSGALETQLTRGDLNGGVNVSIPLTSRDEGFGGAVGDVSLNLSGGLNHLSDFGTLADWSAGLTWSPVDKLNLQATYVARDAAPGLSQLGAPTIISFNVPVFDFTTGQTVLASVTSGGNTNLSKETQRDLKLGVSYQLPLFDRSSVSVEYFRNTSHDVTAGFPLLTPEIEAAFPGRVTRDAATGQILAVDQRPVTFYQQKASRIRTSINLSGGIGQRPDQRGGGGGGSRGGGSAGGPPGAGEGFALGGPPGGPGAGGQGQFNPQGFQKFRQELCAEGANGTPDISGLPEQMQQRLKKDDGTIDSERITEMKQRMCNGQGGAGGPGGGAFMNPEGFQRLRAAFCPVPPADGSPAPAPDLSVLPEQFRQRLMGPAGTPDMERVKQLQDRICAADPTQFGAGAAGGAPVGQGRDGQPAQRESQQASQAGNGGQRASGGGAGFNPLQRRSGNFGRWNISLSHTYELNNQVLIAPGGPLLDLLDGDALSGGGVARHTLGLEGGVFYNGMGVRFQGNYGSKTRVDGSGLPGSTDLYFGDLFKLDLRIFADLGRKEKLVEQAPFFKGSRVSFSIDNLFDARQKVTDSTGATPLRYQPFLIDPLGRQFSVEFRKLF